MGAAHHVDALVLDLDTRAGLCIARSLGRAGLAVSVAARDGQASGLRTRYASSRTVLPDPELDFDAHVAALLALLTEQPADAVLASIDSSVEALHRHREEIGRLAAPALGAPEAVEIALSKERTILVAEELGVLVPRSIPVASAAELEAAAAEIGFPCVLKPVTSWRAIDTGGERVAPIYIADAEQARTVGVALVRADAPVLVQELVGGNRETIKLFRDQGETIARVSMLVERTWPPLGGSSVMRRTISPPADTIDMAERLVAEIGLDGYSEVEFRRDAAGRPRLMEINPRLSQSVELAVRAGVDFPRMQLEWARGGSIPRPPAARIGVRVGWLAGDLRLLVGSLTSSPPPKPHFRSALGAISSDYLLHRIRLEGFTVRDPKPVLGGLAFAFRRLGAGRS